MSKAKLYFHHQYVVIGAVTKDGEEHFALHNPINRVKTGFGAVKSVEDAGNMPKIHRGPTLNPKTDMYDGLAADDVLIPKAMASKANIFTSCYLFTP